MKDRIGRRILIRVDGSYAKGMGHVYRMRALGLELRDIGYDVVFVARADDNGQKILAHTGLRCDVFSPNAEASALSASVCRYKPNLVIQDILTTADDEMIMLRDAAKTKIISIDDEGAGLKMSDIVINRFVSHWGKHDSQKCSAKIYEGPKYMILQKEIGLYKGQYAVAETHEFNVLVAFGGTDDHNITERAVRSLNAIAGKLNIVINMGPGTKSAQGLQNAVDKSAHQIDLVRHSRDIFKLMVSSDLVVCAGGNMLYELAALGVPSVSIAAEREEMFNVGYLSQIGTTQGVGWEGELNESRLSKTIANLLKDKNRRQKMSANGKKEVDGKGLERVVKIIGETLN